MLEVLERFVKEVFAPKTLVVVLSLVSTALLVMPSSFSKVLHTDMLIQKYGYIVGLVWLASTISCAIIFGAKFLDWLRKYVGFKEKLNTAKSAHFSTEMKVIFWFLFGRSPSSVSFLRDHPAIFRLNQLGLIRVPRSPIYFLGSAYDHYELTPLGMKIIELRWDEFKPLDAQSELITDVLARVAEQRWTLSVE